MKPVAIEIENIEEMRRCEGIDDVELRNEIRGLRVGDVVKLTIVSGPALFETLPVRITSIAGCAFRGKLARKPSSKELGQLREGAALAFTSAHIHSVAKSS
ncbi:MAG: hypothetical protein FJ271_25845 [Planctomycetes bacterium]|nr:hypothetical protein [Planctomycetota bacterium]